MNLENLSLVELDAQEVQEIQGGDNPFSSIWHEVEKHATINYLVATHATKTVLGFLAGVGDGIRDGMN
jgi:hypothetical protein